VQWKYQRYMKDYLRCVRSVDNSVGELLKYLDESGLAKNTIVIYSSDQGFYLGEHGWFDKRWMFEESLKMPFLIRWPGVVKPGSRPQALIQNIDYAPTFLDIAGVKAPANMQGKSILPVLKGAIDADFRDAIYYHYYGEIDHKVAAHDGVRTLKHKLMYFPDSDEWNLFDLEKDPNEIKSVHDDPAYADVLESMKKIYTEKRKQYVMNSATTPSARGPMWAEDPKIPPATPGDLWWPGRHRAVLEKVKQGGHQLVFIGDSITQGWEGQGKEIWSTLYSDRKPLNLGFSGDRTQHVMWRLMNGELEHVRPKVFVVMIGTNNTGHNQQDPAETATGVREILNILRDRSPDSKILLLSVFPRGATPDDPLRLINDQVNHTIKTYADGKTIHWLDLNSTFLDKDGNLSKEVMPDLLHPNTKGYQMWAEAMEPTLTKLGAWPAKKPAVAH
jgi:N-acetylglucosamine-6-sulfatase